MSLFWIYVPFSDEPTLIPIAMKTDHFIRRPMSVKTVWNLQILIEDLQEENRNKDSIV